MQVYVIKCKNMYSSTRVSSGYTSTIYKADIFHNINDAEMALLPSQGEFIVPVELTIKEIT